MQPLEEKAHGIGKREVLRERCTRISPSIRIGLLLETAQRRGLWHPTSIDVCHQAASMICSARAGLAFVVGNYNAQQGVAGVLVDSKLNALCAWR